MTQAIYRAKSGILAYSAVSAAISGTIIQLADGRAAVLNSDVDAGKIGGVLTTGQFDVAAATGTTFNDGDLVCWDVDASVAITLDAADLGDYILGTAQGAKISGPLVVRVDLNAQIARNEKEINLAATATLTAADLGATIFGNTQAGAFTITLPAAALSKGRKLTFIRAGTGANALTLKGNASELVDGANTQALMTAIRNFQTVWCDGTSWYVVSARTG